MTDNVEFSTIGQIDSRLADLIGQASVPLLEGDDFFRELVNTLPAAIYATDSAGYVIYFNEAAACVWGARPELGKSRWCGSWRLFWPDGRELPHDQCPMAIAVKERRFIRGLEAVVERPDGSRVSLIPYPTPIYGESGAFLGAVNMMVDISDRKRAEDTEKILVRELQHRSNNLLTVVQAIAQQSLSGDFSLPEARRVFEGRLQALARANDRLIKSNWKGANLSEVVHQELNVFTQRAIIDGVSVMIAAQDVQSFSLILHELATNAVKHGALSNGSGTVAVSWVVQHDGKATLLKFKWQERGGPAVVAPTRRGFGTSLLKSTYKHARVDYEIGGLCCEIDLPIGDSDISTTYATAGRKVDQ
jgi:PAS domain S-box-containing protein